ncbi:hypothetical protein FRX31_019200 [Thalictrum thalictroides]|uniref:Uncharacterized protein n=1 Tax=Thalictrum thalictroides TaxID=46969 RepID=A0A7J6W3V7_THATH|nr:hypothetical protein FRX31_019200 [Thalictrum thalictroides]
MILNGGIFCVLILDDEDEDDDDVERNDGHNKIGEGISQATGPSSVDNESTNGSRRVELPPQANVQLPCKRKRSRFSQDSNYAKGIMEAVQCLADSFSAAPETYMDHIGNTLKKVCGEYKLMYAKGLEFLASNTILGDVFLRLDDDMKLEWLMDKINSFT